MTTLYLILALGSCSYSRTMDQMTVNKTADDVHFSLSKNKAKLSLLSGLRVWAIDVKTLKIYELHAVELEITHSIKLVPVEVSK